MRPLAELSARELADVPGVATDLDDTLTAHGVGLPAKALQAMEALAAQGIPCVIATGRPVGWAQVLASLLPVRAVVAENGAAWARREGGGVRVTFLEDDATRRAGLARARAMTDELRERFPVLQPVEEWAARGSDAVLDIGERARVDRAVVDEALAHVQRAGLFGVASAIHLHVVHRLPDKTAGLLRALEDVGLDPDALRPRWLYVGDSPNDAGAFRAITRSVGVANVRRFAMPAWPTYVTRAEGPEGFAEVVDALLSARREAR